MAFKAASIQTYSGQTYSGGTAHGQVLLRACVVENAAAFIPETASGVAGGVAA